jgi:hypothetical protein
VNSKIGKGVVSHTRFSPIKRKFTYHQSMFLIDLDEINQLSKFSPLLGLKKLYPLSFKSQDHFIYNGESLKESVINFIKSKNPDLEVSKIFLITNLRNFGYVFNPISIYLCFDNQENFLNVVYEVGNTFGEQKLFFTEEKKFIQKKNFYVSPFIDLETNFRFNLNFSEKKFQLSIGSLEKDQLILNAWINLEFRELNKKNLVKIIFSFPFNSLKVFLAIHYQALKLWLKKLPYIKKEDNLSKQTEVLDGKN